MFLHRSGTVPGQILHHLSCHTSSKHVAHLLQKQTEKVRWRHHKESFKAFLVMLGRQLPGNLPCEADGLLLLWVHLCLYRMAMPPRTG